MEHIREREREDESAMEASVMDPSGGMAPMATAAPGVPVGVAPPPVPPLQQQPQQGPSGGTAAPLAAPTSADACLSIVHSLMCHRQGGESESFAKR